MNAVFKCVLKANFLIAVVFYYSIMLTIYFSNADLTRIAYSFGGYWSTEAVWWTLHVLAIGGCLHVAMGNYQRQKAETRTLE